MPLTPEDVQNKRFTVVRFKPGYDEEEVDSFLDEIETELRRLLGENSTLKQTAVTAAAAPPPAPVAPAIVAPAVPEPALPPPPPAAPREDPNETALRTLLLAQRTADDAIAQAQAEAEGIVSAARDKAASMENEAHAAHVSRVATLERERTALESEITSLRTFETEFRTRLKAYLESQLGDLDARPSVAPSHSAPSAPRQAAPTPPPTTTGSAPPPPTSSTAAPAASPAPAPAAAPPSLGVPGLAPAANPAAPPVPPVAPRPAAPATGPFSAAPTPGTPAFGARPATTGSEAATPLAPVPSSPVSSIETDVDAGSDAPSGPPTEAPDSDSDSADE
jgi:DivIVA domain-containing protein